MKVDLINFLIGTCVYIHVLTCKQFVKLFQLGPCSDCTPFSCWSRYIAESGILCFMLSKTIGALAGDGCILDREGKLYILLHSEGKKKTEDCAVESNG